MIDGSTVHASVIKLVRGMPGTKAHRPQPIQSWTEKSAKAYDKVKENGTLSSPRVLYNKGRTAIPVKSTVGGEWELQTCQEFTEWVNNILKRNKHRPITDLKKSLSDGITLVNLLEVLFNEKVSGIQTRPIIRAQRVENVHLCLRFIQGRRIDIQDVDSQQIADGNLRVGLLLITRLRKRFDSKLIATSHDSQAINGSVHGGMEYSNGFHTATREGSIHSYVSGVSNSTQGMLPDLANSLDSGRYNKLRSASFTEKPETVLPGGAFGAEENLESIPQQPGEIVSTTQLDAERVSQHKGGDFQLSRNVSLDVEMSKILLDNHDENGNQFHVSNSVTGPPAPISVEERLKSLLEMPNPGGYTDPNDNQDEGEILELPPPDSSVFLEEEGNFEDEDRLQAMLEDPDNFDDYPKDWDRYVSGYVPSHATEKREGPRAQVMLERAPSPNSVSHYQEPFFHGPPREHLGPSVVTTVQGQPIPGYSNRSRSQPLPQYLNRSGSVAGVVYSEEEAHQSYSGHEGVLPLTADGPKSYNERRLPTYQDHIQRRMNGSLQRLKSSGSSPHSSGYDSRGQVSPSMSRSQGVRSNMEQSGNGLHRHHLERPRSMQQQYYESVHRDLMGSDIMNSTFPQSQQSLYENSQHPQGYDPHMILASSSSGIESYRYPPQTKFHLPGSPPSWKRHSLGETTSDFPQDYEFYSESSTRSHTPELPALSPTETPPQSPPTNKKNRSLSTDHSRVGQNISKSPGSSRRSRETSRSKRNVDKRSNQRRAAGEPKTSAAKRTGGKSKRRNNKGNKQDSPESRRSLRALPSLPLHRVQERPEDFDSDSDDLSRFHLSTELPLPRKEETSSTKENAGPEVSSPVAASVRGQERGEINTIREQLTSLENMYKEMLKVVGAKNAEAKMSPRGHSGSLKKGFGITRSASKVKPGSYRPSVKQRDKDVRAINKRFSRVESHVVTLARSVASLSAELRSQTSLVQEVENIREELDLVRDNQMMVHESALSPSSFKMAVPLATNPDSLKKLTKFFGEEPPLLTLFLTELGYDKYATVFENAGVGLQELPYLSEEQLEKLGIPLGPRTRILQESQLMV